jgi:RHS repeat-associated protein
MAPSSGNPQWQYQYDNNAAHAGTGNRTAVTVNGGTATTATYNALNQLTATTSPSGSFSYDNNGNMKLDAASNLYAWDAENRLYKITYASGSWTSSVFTYDGFDRCVQIVDTPVSGAATTRQYIWSGSKRCQEIDTTGSATTTKQFFTWGEQITNSSGTNQYYWMKDHLGSIREMINNSPAVVAEMSYDPFGVVSYPSGTPSVNSDFGYAGYYNHPPSGLLLTATRAYMPSIGRFINRDPIKESGGTNLYGYVLNNPVSWKDPSGLDYSTGTGVTNYGPGIQQQATPNPGLPDPNVWNQPSKTESNPIVIPDSSISTPTQPSPYDFLPGRGFPSGLPPLPTSCPAPKAPPAACNRGFCPIPEVDANGQPTGKMKAVEVDPNPPPTWDSPFNR